MRELEVNSAEGGELEDRESEGKRGKIRLMGRS